jgi:DAK2 domain fusion protein YloV
MPASLDPETLRRALDLFLEALRSHRDELDSLNVYPVPDGDTGTNMVLTQEAVDAALSSIPQGAPPSVIGPVVSRASLMGARGNSGVILSQILRGIFEVLPSSTVVGAAQLGAALTHASEEAYRAVARPAEGTMLSVFRDAARAARDAATNGAEIDGALSAALEAARDSLARTRVTLPELRQAGVVDAGAKGVVLLLDALHAAVAGRPLSEAPEALGPARNAGARAHDAPGWDSSFEVQYLLEASDDAIPALRAALSDLGDSLVMVGGGGLYNVHVHTDQPDRALAAGHHTGRTSEASVLHLGEQVAKCLSGQARAVRVAEQVCGLVAVVEGNGLVETFRSLGAAVVVGGPGHNPSVGEILAAIESGPAEVVVLPNLRNIVPAVEQAASTSSKDVRVVPVDSVPAGLSAAAAFNPAGPLEENAKAMEQAAAACRSGALARAERDAETPVGPVKAGDWMGFADDEPVRVKGPSSVPGLAIEVTRRLAGPEAEVVTLIVGADARRDRGAVEDALRRSFPHLDVEVVDGGQPGYAFLIGVE